jgi:hypothetical protein
MQVRGKVIKGWVRVPSTPTMEVKEGLVGPQNSGKAEKVAPVSRRRELGLPSIMAITLGSHEAMVIGPGSPGFHQSPVLKDQLGRRDGWGCLDPPP